MIPEDIVTEVTINREVKVHGEPTREVFSTIFDLENVFVINSHILAELRKKLKNKMILGTTSTHKEATYEEMENPSHGAAGNMSTRMEVLLSIAHGLLSS